MLSDVAVSFISSLDLVNVKCDRTATPAPQKHVGSALRAANHPRSLCSTYTNEWMGCLPLIKTWVMWLSSVFELYLLSPKVEPLVSYTNFTTRHRPLIFDPLPLISAEVIHMEELGPETWTGLMSCKVTRVPSEILNFILSWQQGPCKIILGKRHNFRLRNRSGARVMLKCCGWANLEPRQVSSYGITSGWVPWFTQWVQGEIRADM